MIEKEISNYFIRNEKNKLTNLLLDLFVFFVFLNIAWTHQTILFQLVPIEEFYKNGYRPPFNYRVLLRVVYHIFTGGMQFDFVFKQPLSNSRELFHLFTDTLALFIVWKSLTETAINQGLKKYKSKIFSFIFTIHIVVFGYFFVPNRALFYPYDFVELMFFSLFLWLATSRISFKNNLSLILLLIASLNKETAVFGWLIFYIISTYKNEKLFAYLTIKHLIFLMLAGVTMIISKVISIEISNYLITSKQHIAIILHENHLKENFRQLFNPLFWFSMIGIFSYLYIPLVFVRKKLQRIDLVLLILVLIWFLIMFFVGLIRELRLFVPISLVFFYIYIGVFYNRK